MRRLILILTAGLITLLSLTGCVSTQPSNPSTPETPTNPGKLLLKMDLSEALLQTKQLDGKFYLLYVMIKEGSNPDLNWITIEDTNTTVELEKGATYILGIAEKTDQGIKTMGIITTGGLSAIPISLDATSVLDLGKIMRNGDEFYSQIAIDQLANAIGYTKEILENFKGYDVTLKHFLNPDINKNGVFDKQEGLKWLLTSMVDFFIYDEKNYYKNQNNTVEVNLDAIKNISSYLSSEIRLVLWLNWPDLQQQDSVENWNCKVTNNMVQDRDCSYKREGEGGGYYWQFYFRFDRSEIENGKYCFELTKNGTSITLELENVHFAFAMESSEYFVLPIPKVTAYSNGKIEKFGWKWFRWKDEDLDNAEPSLVRLVHKPADDFAGYFYFYTYPDHPLRKNENNLWSIDNYSLIISGHEVTLSKEDPYWIDTGVYDHAPFIRLTAWDVAWNDISVHVPVYFLPYPHDFSENTLYIELPESSFTLINGHYNYEQFINESVDDPLKFAGLLFDTQTQNIKAYTYLWRTRTSYNCRGKEFQGKYSKINDGILKIEGNFINEDTQTYYFIFRATESYIEGNIYTTEPSTNTVNRNAENYRIYSILNNTNWVNP